MTNVESRIGVAVCALGAQATLAQIVVLRAGLERFGGNEFFIGVALTAWLLAGAAGAAAFGRAADRAGLTNILPAIGAAGVSIGTVLSLVVLRWLSTWLSAPGLAMSPLAAAAWMALAAAPPAIMSGVLFAWLVPVVAREFGKSLGLTTLLESLGAAVGGFLFGSVLIDLLGTPGLAAAVLLLGQVATMLMDDRSRAMRRMPALALVLVAAAGVAVVSSRPEAANGVVTDYAENRHGRFMAVELDGQTTIMDGARTLVDCADTQTPELIATVVTAFAPGARDILVPVGTGVDISRLAGLPGISVTMVAPNRDLEALISRHCARTAGRRVTILHEDPLESLARRSTRHDVILLAAGTPDTLNRGRMLSDHAFALAAGRLKPGGTLLVMLDQAEVRPTEAKTRMLAATLKSASGAFARCRIFPIGNWWMVCGAIPEIPDRVIANARKFPGERRYATDTFLADALDGFSMKRLDRRLSEAGPTSTASTALAPSIQVNALLDWAGKYHKSMATGNRTPPKWLLYLLLGMPPFVLLALAPLRTLRRPRRWAWTTAAVTGSAGIVVELALMWAVESAYGALHLWLGGMIAAYMAGLGIGAWIARERFAGSAAGLDRATRISCLAMAIFLVAALAAAVTMVRGLPPVPGIALAMTILTGCSMAAGAAFQFAARRMWLETPVGRARTSGAIRAVDAAVAGLAAVMAVLVFIPIAGTVAVLASCSATCAAMALHKSI